MEAELSRLVDGVPALGSYADVLEEVREVLYDPNSTLTQVGNVLEKDPDLISRLLRLANSAFYGFPTRIDSVSNAISMIGIQQVQDLVTASSVIELFEGVSPEKLNMESFWRHSLACGVVARTLAISRRSSRPEQFFVAGLLHDIGRLILYIRSPKNTRKIFSRYEEGNALLIDVERDVLGFDHTQIGEELTRTWNFPPHLVNAIRFHHTPMETNAFQVEASIIHLADFIVHLIELGSTGEQRIPPLNRSAWKRLDFSTSVLEKLIEESEYQLTDVLNIFLK